MTNSIPSVNTEIVASETTAAVACHANMLLVAASVQARTRMVSKCPSPFPGQREKENVAHAINNEKIAKVIVFAFSLTRVMTSS